MDINHNVATTAKTYFFTTLDEHQNDNSSKRSEIADLLYAVHQDLRNVAQKVTFLVYLQKKMAMCTKNGDKISKNLRGTWSAILSHIIQHLHQIHILYGIPPQFMLNKIESMRDLQFEGQSRLQEISAFLKDLERRISIYLVEPKVLTWLQLDISMF